MAKEYEKRIKTSGDRKGVDTIINAFKDLDKTTDLVKARIATLAAKIKAITDDTDKLVTYQRLLGTTFGENTQKITKYANALSNMTGIAENEMYRQFSLFGQTANSLGLASDAAELYSKNLATLSSKLSILYNIDFATAGKALRDAAKGESSTLATLTGIIVKNTSLQDQLYKLGIDREVSSLNNAERAILQYITVSKQMQNTDNATAQAVNSVAYQKQLLSEQVKRLATAFGKVLYPVLQTILPVFNAILMVITNIVNVFATLIGYKGDTVETASSISTGFDSIGSSASGAAKSLNTSLRSFDKLNNIKTPKDTGYSNGGFSIDPRLQDEFAKMNEEMLNIRNRATEISEKIMKWLGFAKDVNGEWKFSNITFGTIIGALVGSGGILWAGNKIFNLIKKIKGSGGLIGGILGKSSGIGSASSGLSVPNPKSVLKGLGDLAIIIGGIEGIILAIGILKKIPGFNETTKSGLNQIVDVFSKLSKVVLPIGAFSAIVVGLGFATPATVLAGLGGFALVIGGVEAVLVALGELRRIPGFDDVVGSGGQAFVRIGEILGQFAGSIAGGITKGIIESTMSTLPTLGTYLSQFTNNASDFFKSVKNIDSDSMLGVKYTAQAILSMTASNLLDGLSNWLGFGKTNLEAFGKELANFAPYFVEYANAIQSANINGQLVKDSANAAESLAEIAKKLPKQDGWVQKVFGTQKKLSDFGKELADFAPNFAKYANSVKNIDGSVVTNSANAAMSLSELANKLPKQDGVWQQIFGSKKLSAFGEDLQLFGIYFKSYAYNISDIPFAQLSNVNNAVKDLVDISKTIKDKGLSSTIKDFSKNLASSADNFNKYFSNTNGNSIGTTFGNGLARGIGNALKNYKFPSIGLKNALGIDLGTFKIKAYADGGFPEDGLFYANHNELVGKFNNGKTAVANNEDISKGIEQASFQGMMKALMATGGSKQKVEITAEGDASGLLDFITFKQKQTNRRNGL